VTTNAALREIDCSGNRLTSLELTGRNNLHKINCSNNELENLVATNNAVLTTLNCSRNRLEGLDMTNNNALSELQCGNNRMNADELDKLFLTLHNNNTISGEKVIYISGNPGRFACNEGLAEVRGWEVK